MKEEIIKFNEEIIARVFTKHTESVGVKFLTPQNYTLQLGLLEHPTGKIIKDHIHRQDIKYKVDTTQEFLYIEKGRVSISLYSKKWNFIKKVTLIKSDFILFVSGGHGLKILNKARILEIKQGPYPGDGKAKIYRNE